MGTLQPAQMYEHVLIELSGRSTMEALDFSAAPASGELIYAGGVMTLNQNLKFVAGLGDGVANAAAAHNAPMAIFAIQGTNSFDANSDVGNMSGGKQSGLVASGGYEIQTTEFVAGVYKPNDTLTFAVGSDVRGKVTLSANAYSTQHIVGVVSSGTGLSTDGQSVIGFWPVWMPAVNLA